MSSVVCYLSVFLSVSLPTFAIFRFRRKTKFFCFGLFSVVRGFTHVNQHIFKLVLKSSVEPGVHKSDAGNESADGIVTFIFHRKTD